MKPVMLRDVALGDGDEARQPRFRREQVVERRYRGGPGRRRRRADSRSRRCAGGGRTGSRTASRRRARDARAARRRERPRRLLHAAAGRAPMTAIASTSTWVQKVIVVGRCEGHGGSFASSRVARAPSPAVQAAPSVSGRDAIRASATMSRARRLIAVDGRRGSPRCRRSIDETAASTSAVSSTPFERAASRSAGSSTSARRPCASAMSAPPGCRCRRSRRSAGRAAPASPCRTSSESGPRDARDLRASSASRSSRR